MLKSSLRNAFSHDFTLLIHCTDIFCDNLFLLEKVVHIVYILVYVKWQKCGNGYLTSDLSPMTSLLMPVLKPLQRHIPTKCEVHQPYGKGEV